MQTAPLPASFCQLDALLLAMKLQEKEKKTRKDYAVKRDYRKAHG